MSGSSHAYDNPYEEHYNDHYARRDGADRFDQDTSYVQEGYYPHDSTSSHDFQ